MGEFDEILVIKLVTKLLVKFPDSDVEIGENNIWLFVFHFAHQTWCLTSIVSE